VGWRKLDWLDDGKQHACREYDQDDSGLFIAPTTIDIIFQVSITPVAIFLD